MDLSREQNTSVAVQLSFVFPCLNEEATLGQCIEWVQGSLRDSGVAYEIIVADNGSTDRSIEIAESLGARVEHVTKRGYGAALQGGIGSARGEYVAFADADSTYLVENVLELYQTAVRENADMTSASRLRGTIESGAMPFLHRYLGTPVITMLINLLFDGQFSDSNSGFRCLKKSSYEQWNVRADGMEFIGELLIKALKAKAKIVEIRSGLRCGPKDRVAHLRTWRDGMRNLLFIFSERPELFECTGLFLVLTSSVLQVLAFLLGPVALGPLNMFDLHSQALLLLAGLGGAQFYLFSWYLYLASGSEPLPFTKQVLQLEEDVLFFSLVGLGTAAAGVVAYIFWQWASASFHNIDLINSLLFIIHCLCVFGTLTIGLLGIHVFMKSEVKGHLRR
jgi:glycosyltransferase involved in cell wall biosynthesis